MQLVREQAARRRYEPAAGARLSWQQCAGRRGCTAELQWLFVLPQWQRQGVGGELLRPLREWFVARKGTRVIIDAPPANPYRAFYLRHGAVALDGYWLYWKDIGTDEQIEGG